MSTKLVQKLDRVVIRFAGDSGDGMQLTGDRFTSQTALLGNDLSTLPNFPAEIRAPQGTLPGVSSFQLHFADHDVLTPGDAPDVLVAMNPAALKANLRDLPRGATIIVNTDEFTKRNLSKVGYAESPLEDGSLESYDVHPVALTSIAVEALASFTDLTRKEKERAKNMFALGLLSWLYTRPMDGTEAFLKAKFADKPDILEANLAALRAGFNYGETTEDFAVSYEVAPATMPAGHLPQRHRQRRAVARPRRGGAPRAPAALPRLATRSPRPPTSCTRSRASSATASRRCRPRTRSPVSARRSARRFGGALGVTTTSGPGPRAQGRDHRARRVARAAADRLRHPARRPVDRVCRPRPSRPTCSRPSSAATASRPVAVVAPATPADCFDIAVEAVRIATTYRTPGHRAVRRLPRQRLRAVAAAAHRPSCPTSPWSSRPSRTPWTTRGSRSSTPTCATPRRSPGRGRSRARPASSTASAASRRPTSPATSPTTPTTTTT